MITGIGGIKAHGRGASLLDLRVRAMNGEDVPLSRYRGQVLLIVNVASKCGCTPQYHDLVALDESYRQQGLAVLGFPCNDFAGQEPGSTESIAAFCGTNFGVTFEVFDKVRTKGPDTAPLFQRLVSPANAPFDGGIGWNFTKFLAGRDGVVRARFEPGVKPTDPAFIQVLEALLAEPAPGGVA
ncbi:MAG: glutathione peroxidase [Candidatus Competibacteraceae bacterium]|nr:glutathione peroxidase [Candidatus Competibacteraceae bacterium]